MLQRQLAATAEPNGQHAELAQFEADAPLDNARGAERPDGTALQGHLEDDSRTRWLRRR